jgi:hypothetical protein
LNLPEALGITNFQIVDDDVALLIAQQWLSVFCKHRTTFRGIRGGKSYLWDEIHSDWQNQEAVGKYGGHFAPSYYLMPDNFGEFKKEIFVTRTKPSGNFKLLDFHVFPKNFAWSMAFTHEDGWIGPKFFKHDNYLQLNKNNIKACNEISRSQI